MATDLTNVAVSVGYTQLLHVDGGIGSSTNTVLDGDGTGSPLKIATATVEIADGANNFDVVSHDGTNGLKLGGTLVTTSAAEINLLDGITAGTVSASKFLLVDSNKDLTGLRNLTGTGTCTFVNFVGSGDITLGDAADDSVTFSADVNSNIIPNTDDTFDLGSSAQQWKDLYLDGIAYIDVLGADGDPSTVYIGGGEIDSTVIGGETPAAGTFTTLVANGNVDLGNATSDTITATGYFDSHIIPSADDSYDLGSATNAWQDLFLEGDLTLTDAGTIATTAGDLTINAGSGEIQFGNENLTTTGTIDSGTQTVTGNVTASGTIQAEQLTSTDDLTVTDTASIDGTMTLATGSITDSSGAITFGDENLSTTGTLASGAQTVTGNLTVSGTVQAEQLTSTDDLTIQDTLSVDGTMTLATGSITDSTGALSFGNENLTTSGTLASGAQTVTGNVTASGTVSAEQITTTDDLTVSGLATIGETLAVTGVATFTAESVHNGGMSTGALVLNDGSITDTSGAITFGNENLTTTGTITAEQLTTTDDLTVSGLATIG